MTTASKITRFALVPVVGILAMGFASGAFWVAHKGMNPKALTLPEVQEVLVGDSQTVVRAVFGWGSERLGFDDGSDWIEFSTDSSGATALLESRPFVQILNAPEPDMSHWTRDIQEWAGPHLVYRDDSEFEPHGTSYMLMTRQDGNGVRALIVRMQQ